MKPKFTESAYQIPILSPRNRVVHSPHFGEIKIGIVDELWGKNLNYYKIMKRLSSVKVKKVLTGFFFVKLADAVFRPFKNIPVPDFNHTYDETIL